MSLGILYAFFYATRYNNTAVAPLLADLLGWKNTELGVFETMLRAGKRDIMVFLSVLFRSAYSATGN